MRVPTGSTCSDSNPRTAIRGSRSTLDQGGPCTRRLAAGRTRTLVSQRQRWALPIAGVLWTFKPTSLGESGHQTGLPQSAAGTARWALTAAARSRRNKAHCRREGPGTRLSESPLRERVWTSISRSVEEARIPRITRVENALGRTSEWFSHGIVL